MKTVLITGGSRGIGRAMVIAFCKKGYRVAFTYKASHTDAAMLSDEYGAVAICADSEDENEILKAVEITEKKLGNIEILINNAAVSSFSMINDITTQEWRRTFSVNVDAPFLYTKAVVGGMIRNKYGRIINISSMWGEVGSSCEVHYSASKAALIGMSKALAKELGPSGITVNCIAPGIINTDMNSAVDKDVVEELIEQTPLMRLGTPADVANAALFLAGEGGDFITGAVLDVNGGFVIR